MKNTRSLILADEGEARARITAAVLLSFTAGTRFWIWSVCSFCSFVTFPFQAIPGYNYCTEKRTRRGFCKRLRTRHAEPIEVKQLPESSFLLNIHRKIIDSTCLCRDGVGQRCIPALFINFVLTFTIVQSGTQYYTKLLNFGGTAVIQQTFRYKCFKLQKIVAWCMLIRPINVRVVIVLYLKCRSSL